MTLASWLSSSEMSAAQFAQLIGVSRQALWRYKAGERVPRVAVIRRIADATKGQVTANDFLGPSEAEGVAA